MEERNWVFEKIREQKKWRSGCINLIASENATSPAVEAAYFTDFMHRYAEGVPYKRYYQGTRVIDEIETKANEFFAKKLGGKNADVRPIAGAIANMAVLRAFTQPGDIIASLSVPSGAHSSHSKGGVAGLLGLNTVEVAFDAENFSIDAELSSEIIRRAKPKIAMIGASLLLFPLDIKGLSGACKEVGCKLVYDSAHVFGLVFSGKFQKPFAEGADILTTSTHKTFPGPQGGLIAGNVEEADWTLVQKGVFPKILSNHHLHRIPALLVAGYEMSEFGEAYSSQILKNAKALAQALSEEGLNVCAEERGFTESHQVVVNVRSQGGGKPCAEALEKADIILNKNLIPVDKLNFANLDNPSGIRMGVQEMTRYGMKQGEMKEIAGLISRVVMKNEDPAKVKQKVNALRSGFQTIHYTWEDFE